MKTIIPFLTVLLLLGPLGAQEVEITQRPKPAPSQLQKDEPVKPPVKKAKPAPKAAKAPKAAPHAPAAAAPPALPPGVDLKNLTPDKLPPGVTMEDVKRMQMQQAAASKGGPKGSPKAAAAPAAPVHLPPVYDLGPYCIAKTRYLQDSGKEIIWKGQYEPFTPSPQMLKQFMGSANVPPALLPYLKYYKINGSETFGEHHDTHFFGYYLVNGPGVLKAAMQKGFSGAEVVDAEHKTENGREVLVLAFSNLFVTLVPARGAEQYDECLALAYNHGSLVNYPRQTNSTVPFSPDGILAVKYSKYEAVGLFRFPMARATVPMHGVRWGDELWLESEQNRQTTLAVCLQGTQSATRGITGVDGLRPLRIKVRLTEPRALEVCFVAKGFGHWNFSMPGDLHEQSLVSLSVPASRLHPLPELQKAFLENFQSPSWRSDDSPESFMGQADASYLGAGLPLELFMAQEDSKGKIACDPYRQMAVEALKKAKALNGKSDLINPPNL